MTSELIKAEATNMTQNSKIDSHPAIKFNEEIQRICSPLGKLGITYFAHANIHENKLSAICSNPDFFQYYLNNNYQNADIHMVKDQIKQKYFIWDDIVSSGKSADLDDASMSFGIYHTFTLHRKNELGDHFYHFATSHRDIRFNHVYLNNLDLLDIFIDKFNITTNNSSLLSSSYDIKFSLDENQSSFNLSKGADLKTALKNREEFLNAIWEDKQFPLNNGTTLSLRQLLILYWLYNGKTINDISRILELAEVTLHKQINNLKEQINCYTQFQLGVFFSNLTTDVKEIMIIIDKNNGVKPNAS